MSFRLPSYPSGGMPPVSGPAAMTPPGVVSVGPAQVAFPSASGSYSPGADTLQRRFSPQDPIFSPGSGYRLPAPLAQTVPLQSMPSPPLAVSTPDPPEKAMRPELREAYTMGTPIELFPEVFGLPSRPKTGTVIAPGGSNHYQYTNANYYPWAQGPPQQAMPGAQSIDKAPPPVEDKPPPEDPSLGKATTPKTEKLPHPEVPLSPEMIEEFNTALNMVEDPEAREKAAVKLGKLMRDHPDILDMADYGPYAEALLVKALRDRSSDVRREVLLGLFEDGLNRTTPRIDALLDRLCRSSADAGLERKTAQRARTVQQEKRAMHGQAVAGKKAQTLALATQKPQTTQAASNFAALQSLLDRQNPPTPVMPGRQLNVMAT